MCVARHTVAYPPLELLLSTTKFPAFLVLLEVAEQVEERDISLDVMWAPREENTEADALTHEDFSGLDPALRINVVVQDLPLRVLRGWWSEASDLFEDMRAEQTRRRGAYPLPSGALVGTGATFPWLVVGGR
eukprot:5484222-Amphidinium_carterae.1